MDSSAPFGANQELCFIYVVFEVSSRHITGDISRQLQASGTEGNVELHLLTISLATPSPRLNRCLAQAECRCILFLKPQCLHIENLIFLFIVSNVPMFIDFWCSQFFSLLLVIKGLKFKSLVLTKSFS